MKDLLSLNINIRPLHQYIHAVEFCNIWATIYIYMKNLKLVVYNILRHGKRHLTNWNKIK